MPYLETTPDAHPKNREEKANRIFGAGTQDKMEQVA